MTRKRMIVPQFWKDPDIIRLQPLDRLLVLAMISLADDYGNTMADEYVLKIEVFGIDDITPAEVGDMRDRIFERCRNFERYEVDGQVYVHIANWTKHQKLRYRARPVWPLFPGQIADNTTPDDGKADTPDANTPQDGVETPIRAAETPTSGAETPQDSGLSKGKQGEDRQRQEKAGKGSMHACMPPPKNDKSPPTDDLNLEEVLQKYGVAAPSLDELLADPWITPIRAYACQQAISKRENIRNPVGLLITMLEDHDEPPVPPPRPGSAEDRQRYVTGEYADYIDH